jgi:CheY-like chemotaxis protein
MNNKKTILLVDDDFDVLEQLTFMLRGDEYTLVTAQGRAEAEESLMTIQPDLAVIDLMMEEMDAGFVLCHEIKKMYPGTPVIIHSAVTASTGISFPAGTAEEKSWIMADAFMDKPIRAEQLKSQIRQLLGAPEAKAKH